jgi:multidrug efflux system membrane fusion protein
LVIAGRVSEAEVGRLQLGSRASGTLLSGEQVEGELVFIGHEADEVTRTFRVEVSVPNESYRLRSGISADLTVPLEPVQAHRVPSALLSLDDRGRIGLRIVDDEEQVRFVLVELVGDDVDGVWVSGLPERALLITVGQEYVSNGQQVAVSLETGRAAP